MLEDLKLLLGILNDQKDEVLELLIRQATFEVKSYTNRDDVANLKDLILQIAIIKYNRMGTEGLASESYSGSSYSYIDTYPDNIIKHLKRMRRLKTI